MKAIWFVVLGLLGVLLVGNALSWGLGSKMWFFIVFNFGMIFLFIGGLVVWYVVIKPKIGEEQSEITEKELEIKAKEYLLDKVGVVMGEIYESGFRNLGSEGAKKCEIYYILCKDRDNADHYCVGLNVERLVRRNWCKNPSDTRLREMLSDLADTREQNIVTTREYVDPMRGNVRETSKQPFYLQKEKEDDEGDI